MVMTGPSTYKQNKTKHLMRPGFGGGQLQAEDSSHSTGLPSLVASKVLSHRVPAGGGYMPSYGYSKQNSSKQQPLQAQQPQAAPAAVLNTKMVSKAVYNPQRASAYRYKSSLAASMSNASNTLSSTLNASKKYVSPYSQRALNSFIRE